jgi:hypothetical protein
MDPETGPSPTHESNETRPDEDVVQLKDNANENPHLERANLEQILKSFTAQLEL